MPPGVERWEPAAALLLILAVLGGFQARTRTHPLHEFDQAFYIGIAYDLRHAGLFSGGHSFGAGADRAEQSPLPGMRFAPLYPAFLAAAAGLDAPFAAALDCAVTSGGQAPTCSRAATLVRGVQLAMVAATYWLVWWLAGAITGGRQERWTALVLALFTAPLLVVLANYLMTETVALFLATAATAAGLQWLRTERRTALAAAGLLLGLAALTRPAFFYLGAAIVLAGVLAWRRGRTPAPLLLFAAAFALPVLPWMARNAIVLGHFGLTFGYDSHTLVQRIAFDSMTWREYGLSFVCWLPDGNGLGRLIAGPAACDRFGWDDHLDSFYSIGNGPLLQQTLAAAGGLDHHLSYLLRTAILPHPFWHAATTLPLALRGAWIEHYWGFLLGIVCAITTAQALVRRSWPFLLVAGPAWFMLVFNAAVAVNQVRYNLLLIAPYAIAGSMLLTRIKLTPQPSSPGLTREQKS